MRLTCKQVQQALQMKAAGYKWNGIALHFGVNQPLLARYVRAYHRYGQTFWQTERIEQEVA